MRIHVDVALDALLAVVGPRISRHPLPFALGTLVLAEATLLALVRRLAFGLGTSLRTISNVVTLLEAQVAQIVSRRNFAVLLVLLAVANSQQRMLMLKMVLFRVPSTARKRPIQARSRPITTIPKPVQTLQSVGISVTGPGTGQRLCDVLRLRLLLMVVMMLMVMLLEQLTLGRRMVRGLVPAQPKKRQVGKLVTKFGNTIGQGRDGIVAALRRWKWAPQRGE